MLGSLFSLLIGIASASKLANFHVLNYELAQIENMNSVTDSIEMSSIPPLSSPSQKSKKRRRKEIFGGELKFSIKKEEISASVGRNAFVGVISQGKLTFPLISPDKMSLKMSKYRHSKKLTDVEEGDRVIGIVFHKATDKISLKKIINALKKILKEVGTDNIEKLLQVIAQLAGMNDLSAIIGEVFDSAKNPNISENVKTYIIDTASSPRTQDKKKRIRIGNVMLSPKDVSGRSLLPLRQTIYTTARTPLTLDGATLGAFISPLPSPTGLSRGDRVIQVVVNKEEEKKNSKSDPTRKSVTTNVSREFRNNGQNISKRNLLKFLNTIPSDTFKKEVLERLQEERAEKILKKLKEKKRKGGKSDKRRKHKKSKKSSEQSERDMLREGKEKLKKKRRRDSSESSDVSSEGTSSLSISE